MSKIKVASLSILVILILAFYFLKLLSILSYSHSSNFTFKLPEIQLLRIKLQNINPEVVASMCGIRNKELLKQGENNRLENKNKMLMSVYEYGEKDGISFVYRISNPNYKWFLYGIAYKNTTPIAVFYNPKTLKLVAAVKGDKIDKDLVVVDIKQDKVYIKNHNKIFKLRIFKIISRRKAK